MKFSEKDSDLVYSTSGGKICRKCRKPVPQCICRDIDAKKIVDNDGIVRVGRETKGRKGKGVTVVTGIPLPADELLHFAGTLKRKCGCGGTVRDGIIEIQGDKRDLLVDVLTKQGYRVKKSGG